MIGFLLGLWLQGQGALATVQTVSPPEPAADVWLVPLAQGAHALVAVGRAGAVRTWLPDERTGFLAEQPVGELVLADPAHTLLAIGPGADPKAPQLIALTPNGATRWVLDPQRGFDGAGTPVAPRARFTLRLGEPRFAAILEDINKDGRADLVVPGLSACELWTATPEQGFARAARLDVYTDVDNATRADRLSDGLRSAVTIPDLTTQDVNGDGRPDLVVAQGQDRAWHLQRPDGSFPQAPDLTVDLSLFRDTTPEAAVKPGRTLAGTNRAHMTSRDLDGDGIPDFVIAHRRKVWVFHGGKEGPQFVSPSSILKVADDVTALQLARLDDDAFVDLLLVKVQVPTVGSLIMGLVGEWDVDLSVLGYASKAGKTFDTTPKWRSELTLRLPAILSMIRNPEALFTRFEEIGRKVRRSVTGDLDGDQADEVVQVSEDQKALEVWRGKPGDARSGEGELDRLLRRVLFEEPDTVWTLDRLLGLFRTLVERRAERLTGGRAADQSGPLRDPAAFELVELLVRRGSDGKGQLLCGYRERNTGATVIDLLR